MQCRTTFLEAQATLRSDLQRGMTAPKVATHAEQSAGNFNNFSTSNQEWPLRAWNLAEPHLWYDPRLMEEVDRTIRDFQNGVHMSDEVRESVKFATPRVVMANSNAQATDMALNLRRCQPS